MEDALATQRYAALQAQKLALDADLAKSEAANKALQAEKAALQADCSKLRNHRDRLIVQKKTLKVRPRAACLLSLLSMHPSPCELVEWMAITGLFVWPLCRITDGVDGDA